VKKKKGYLNLIYFNICAFIFVTIFSSNRYAERVEHKNERKVAVEKYKPEADPLAGVAMFK